MKRLHYTLLALFIADFITDSVIAEHSFTNWRYVSKGLLMPLLLAFFLTGLVHTASTASRKYAMLVCFALIFSFAGDILLIGESSLYFMLGIAAFLIAHIFYIILFNRIQSFSTSNSRLLLISASIILAYVILLDYLFLPSITKQQLTIPVIVYSFVLGMMLFAAVNVVNTKLQPKAFVFYIVSGAILFVASDSMIAFNKFYLSKPLNGFYIMSTYALAQLLIISGALKFLSAKKNAGKTGIE